MSDYADNPAPGTGDTGQAPFGAVDLRRGSRWIAVVLAIMGLVFAWQALKLDLGTVSLPGPGFVPLVLSLLTVVLACLVWIRERARPDPEGTGSSEMVELGHRDVLIVFAAMLAVPPLFEPLGAYLTLGLFGAVLLVLIARTPVLIAAVAATAGMVGCWYFFQVALGLQLPVGSALEWLGSLWNG